MGNLERFRQDGNVYDNKIYDFLSSIAPSPHERIPLDSILVGVSGTRVYDQDDYAITHVSFIFRLMVPSSLFLITKEKKSVRRALVKQNPADNDDDDDSESDDYDQYVDYEYFR